MSTPNPTQVQSSLATSLEVLFGGAATTATLRDGTEIEFRPAKMKHLGALITVFETAVSALSTEEFEDLLALIVERQEASQQAGKSVNDVDISDFAKLAEIGKHNMALVSKLFHALLDILPKVVPLFTNLTSEQYDNLLIDEGILVPVGIVGVNYPFFTQSLLPALIGSFSSMTQKRMEAQATKIASRQQNGKKG